MWTDEVRILRREIRRGVRPQSALAGIMRQSSHLAGLGTRVGWRRSSAPLGNAYVGSRTRPEAGQIVVTALKGPLMHLL